jgi:hypothetical protein
LALTIIETSFVSDLYLSRDEGQNTIEQDHRGMTVHFGQTLKVNVCTSEISHEDEPSTMVEPVMR